MKNKNIIGVLILMVGFVGLSHAGFKDALKSAAGSALNEVAGTAIVTQEIPVKNVSTTDQPQNPAVTNNTEKKRQEPVTTQQAAVDAPRANILKEVQIEDESMATEKFRAEKKLSEKEYAEWLQDVVNAVRDPSRDMSEINAEKIFSYEDIRVKLPSSETVIRVNRADGVVLTDKAAYRLYSAVNKGCIRNNYEELALSGSTGSPSCLREYGTIAQEKLSELLDKREQLADAMQKEKEEGERNNRLKNLKASRSGKVAFRIGQLDLQWGDSADVLRELCGVYPLEVPTLLGITDYYVGSLGDGITDKKTSVCADIDVGLFEVKIAFPSQEIGGTVTLEDLVKKYSDKYGKPETLVDGSEKTVIGYRWTAENEAVVVGYNNLTDAIGNNLGAFPTVILTNSEMDKNRKEAVRKRAEKNEKARQAESNKALDF